MPSPPRPFGPLGPSLCDGGTAYSRLREGDAASTVVSLLQAECEGASSARTVGVNIIEKADGLEYMNNEWEADDEGNAREGGHVMLAESVYYALEGEDEEMEVQVLRLGEEAGPASVSYYTEDGSAHAGSKYLPRSGTLHFGPYERSKTIQIPIVNDSDWATAVEFQVHLRDPVGCKLSHYHRSCHVKIIDDDVFPTDRHAELIRANRIDEIGSIALIKEYLKFSLKIPGVRWRAMLTLVLDQFHTLYFLLTIYLHRYLVNVVFATDEEASASRLLWRGSRRNTAMCVACLHVAPFLLLHLVDVLKRHLDLGGIALKYLQTNMYRKYLDYSEAARSKIAPSAMTYCITNQTRKVVVSGLMQAIGLVRLAGKLGIIVLVASSHKEEHTDDEESYRGLLAVVLFPVLVACWLYCSLPRYVELNHVAAHAEVEVMHSVHQTTSCYRLIADYQHRSQLADQFEGRIEDLTRCRLAQEIAELNDTYMPGWLSNILTGGYILLFSEKVLEGRLTLGTFLTMIRIFHDIGADIRQAYVEVMELVRIIGPLRKITALMNESTDLLLKREASRARRQEMHRWMRLEPAHSIGRRPLKRREANNNLLGGEGMTGQASLGKLASFFETSDRVDEVPIEVRGLQYAFPAEDAALDNQAAGGGLYVEHLHTSQGELVAVVGPHQSGKRTFLMLLAGILHADSGVVFIPVHLRCLHVAAEPMVLEGGLLHNLTFSAPNESPERVLKVLERLGASAAARELRRELAAGTGGPGDEMGWRWRVSSTELQLVQLARALVVNPEVLFVQRPAAHLDRQACARVMRVLAEHVAERGLEVDGCSSARRPRTCFYVCSDRDLARECADRIWQVGGGTVTQSETSRRSCSSLGP